ncbi:hypothetical protein [Stenotrophomonas maltophilia]|nr:hypothetical protein [Stenotrophomonas maltophilia]
MQILNLRVIYVFLGMGLIALIFAPDLVDTRLGGPAGLHGGVLGGPRT